MAHFLSLFSADVMQQCGNYEVEEGEECDAGFLGMIDADDCCNPNCTLKPEKECRYRHWCSYGRISLWERWREGGRGTVCVGCLFMFPHLVLFCSDVSHACCDGCFFAELGTVCREYAPGNLQCLESVRCTGSSAICPVDDLSYVPIESSCRGDGKCYPMGSLCSGCVQ